MWLRLVVLLTLLALPVTAAAQAHPPATDAGDAEARALFELGTAAFDDARYEDALGHFQHAYERSHRAALLYNIGICADRLRRDAEALDAFERFLAAIPDHPLRRDVEARVEILRRAVAERAEPVTPPGGEPDALADSGSSTLAVAGPIALGTVGLAGVVAGLVGIAGAGGCVDYAVPGDASSACIEETRTSWAPVAVYGGLGLAALVGAVVWFVIGLSGGDDEDSPVALSARGTELVWRF